MLFVWQVEEWRAAKEAQEKKQLEEKRRHEAKDGANANEVRKKQCSVNANGRSSAG